MEKFKKALYYIFNFFGVFFWVLAFLATPSEDSSLKLYLINVGLAIVGSLFICLSIKIDRQCDESNLEYLIDDDFDDVHIGTDLPPHIKYECYVIDDNEAIKINNPPTEWDRAYLFALSVKKGKEQENAR